jgi:hypothetical protein
LSAFADRGRESAIDFRLAPGERERASLPSLGEAAARDYRRRARMPESTHALEAGADPVAEARQVSPASAAGPEGEEPTLTALPTQVGYEAPEAAVVHAFFSMEGERLAAESLVATIIGERRGTVAVLEMNDEGRDGDEIAGDLVYGASWRPPQDEAPEFRGTYVASVRGRTTALDERAVSTGFLYSVPLARPTGRFRDAIVDGSLRLEAELEVFASGRFHAETTLASATGESVAWAQNAASLPPGTHWLPITVYGLVFHERGIPGPYVVKSFALSTVGEMPNQKNRILYGAHTTQAYALAQFTDEPYGDPDLLDAAERAQRDAPVAPGAQATH